MIFQYGLMSLCMHGVVAVIAAVFPMSSRPNSKRKGDDEVQAGSLIRCTWFISEHIIRSIYKWSGSKESRSVCYCCNDSSCDLRSLKQKNMHAYVKSWLLFRTVHRTWTGKLSFSNLGCGATATFFSQCSLWVMQFKVQYPIHVMNDAGWWQHDPNHGEGHCTWSFSTLHDVHVNSYIRWTGSQFGVHHALLGTHITIAGLGIWVLISKFNKYTTCMHEFNNIMHACMKSGRNR